MTTTTHGPSWGIVIALALLAVSVLWGGYVANLYVQRFREEASVHRFTEAEYQASQNEWRTIMAAVEAEQASR